MKVKVFSETEAPKEPEIHLRLQQEDGAVLLMVVDWITGCCVDNGIVARISSDGLLYLHWGVNPDIGLQLDGSGTIRLS